MAARQALLEIPAVRLTIPPCHVGGTFVETPGRIGPWQASNGDLYFIMEPAETGNLFMMVKSTDNGVTWREVDGANRPPIRDLEAVDARQVGDTIHILHEVSRSARYHSFRTSDHRTQPDSWAVRENRGDVAPVAQAAALEVRSDGSLVAFYVGPTKIHYRIRSPAGKWGGESIIDPNLLPTSPDLRRCVARRTPCTWHTTEPTGRSGIEGCCPTAPSRHEHIASGAGTPARNTGRCCRSSTLPRRTRL